MTPAFLITSHWHDHDQHTELVFWWHTDQGPVRTAIEQACVCFIEQADQERARAIVSTLQWPIDIRSVPLRHFNQQPACACYLPSHYLYRWRDVLAQQGIVCREVDIRPTDRYLMERFIYGQAYLVGEIEPSALGAFSQIKGARLRALQDNPWRPNFRCLSLDIETSFPRRGEPDRLFSIGLYSDDVQRVLMVGQGESSELLQFFDDEKEVLNAFIEQLNVLDPDVIMGWNLVQFDIEFLRRKCLEHHIPFALGRDGSEVQWRVSQTHPDRIFLNIAGRVALDGIDLLKSASYHFESFALNDIAQHFLGDEKLLVGDDRGSDIEHLFVHDPQQLARYNLKDCELVWRIFQQADLLNFAIERSKLTGLHMDRMGGSVAAFENMYLPRLHRAGWVAPNMMEGYHEQKSPGGYVMASCPGLFDHVLVLDFKSLYPSIIRTFKIDPLGLIEGLATPEGDRRTTVEGFFGGRFHQQHHVLPNLIANLSAHREQAKCQGNEALNQAIKVIMASCYGVLGSEGCRFYDTRLSSSITMRGHQIIQDSAAWLAEQGYEVIYGDTDSVFVWLKQIADDEAAKALGLQLAQGLNDRWRARLAQEFAIESHLEMEFDTYYRRFFMPSIRGEETGSKKRYAGLVRSTTGEQTLVFKGLEAVRSDWTPLARRFQRELYRRIFLNEPYHDWLRQQVQDLFAGQLNHELIYRKRLRRPLSAYQRNVPPHAQAAQRLEQWLQVKGLPSRFAQRGGWITYRITLNGPEPVWPDGSPSSAIDYWHYFEKQLLPPAQSIFQYTGDDFMALAGQQLPLF